jgi:hypothetical protein
MARSSARTKQHSDQQEPESAPTHKSAPSVQPVEPPTEPHHGQAANDPHRSRHLVLRLNTEGHQGEQHPETPAGQHATGSFTTDPGERRKSK